MKMIFEGKKRLTIMIGDGRLLEIKRGRHGNFDGGRHSKFLEVMGFSFMV
jgi:hypothetical protein